MTKVTELLDAGVHFGHLTRKWNPNMAPYIFMERNGIHIIDLNKTKVKLDEAAEAMKKIARSGRKIMYVATKKQAKEIVAQAAQDVNMPYITERWPGGMLTNFVTIRKAVKKMSSIDKMKADGTFLVLSKRERLQIDRQRAKLEKNLGSISDMSRLPAALFVVDVKREAIAIAEARKLSIPTFAIVDTNSDPELVDFAIPANDDASKSITIIINALNAGVIEGLSDRKKEKDLQAAAKKDREDTDTNKKETDVKSNEEGESDEKIKAKSEAKVNKKTEPKSEVKVDKKTELKSEVKVKVKTKAKPRVKTKVKTKVSAEKVTKKKVATKAPSGAKPIKEVKAKKIQIII
jgi:small subunit ribosomal protein S2